MKLISSTGSTISIQDASASFRYCSAQGFPTLWWESKANTITLRSGPSPSSAYLLLSQKDLRSLSKTTLDSHSIRLYSSPSSFFTSRYWIFKSASPIDPALSPEHEKAIFLVEFQDSRCLVTYHDRDHDNGTLVRPEGMYNPAQVKLYNLVHSYQATPPSPAGSSQPHQGGERFLFYPHSIHELVGQPPIGLGTPNPFPSDPQTHTPFTWKEVFEDLADNLPPPLSTLLVTAVGFTFPPSHLSDSTTFPKFPLNIRTQDPYTWTLLNDYLNALGITIYPQLSGGYVLAHFFSDPIENYCKANNPSFINLDHRGETLYLPETLQFNFPEHSHQWNDVLEENVQGDSYTVTDPVSLSNLRSQFSIYVPLGPILPLSERKLYRSEILSTVNPTLQELEYTSKVEIRSGLVERIPFPFHAHYTTWKSSTVGNKDNLQELCDHLATLWLDDVFRERDFTTYTLSGLHPLAPNKFHRTITFNFSSLGPSRTRGPCTIVAP